MSHFLRVYECGCLHSQCRCPAYAKTREIVPGKCPVCRAEGGGEVSERDDLIAEGEQYDIGYEPAEYVYRWILRALLFLLREGRGE